MFDRREHHERSLPAETRAGLLTIILISALAFLLFQSRQVVVTNVHLHEARLAFQAASVATRQGLDNAILDSPDTPTSDLTASLQALPGQVTLVSRQSADMAQALGMLGISKGNLDTSGKFIIRDGKLFASTDVGEFIVMTSAPLGALTAGLLGRISADIAGVSFLGFLLLLVRESRLSDYSVRRLLDASPVPLFVMDADGTTQYANRAALGLFSAVPAGDLNRFNEGLKRHNELFLWLVDPREPTEKIETRDFRIMSPEQADQYLVVSRQSLLVRSRSIIIVSAADISVRQEAENALIKAKEAAESLGRMKSESLAMISHELKTPVNGVLGLAQLLAAHPLPESAARIVRRMSQAGKTLAVIINDIVDLAILETGHLRLERRNFDPQETIDSAVILASAAATQKGLAVRVVSVTPLPAIVVGDPARLQQIIINLVGNGIKFTEAGQIEVKTDIVARSQDSIEIAIEVTDTGVGIPQEVLPRLFQPFSQAEVGHTRRFEGTGLGLAISKRLADAMGGEISVRSEVGCGSIFLVRLRFGIGADVAPADPIAMTAHRVLVVDDVALNRDIVADLLRGEGCDVVAVGSGQAAIDILKIETFDLVLMDIRMPGMDGLSATATIRGSREAIRHLGPVLGLTANPVPTDRPLYLLRGIDGVIEKPIEIDQLRTTLQQYEHYVSATTEQPARIERLCDALGTERAIRIVEAFSKVANDAAEAIADLCSRLDFVEIREAAHRLSGAASNIGLMELSDAAAELEEISQKCDPLQVSQASVNVILEFKVAQRLVESWKEQSIPSWKADNQFHGSS